MHAKIHCSEMLLHFYCDSTQMKDSQKHNAFSGEYVDFPCAAVSSAVLVPIGSVMPRVGLHKAVSPLSLRPPSPISL